jgi:phage baseplate assembly protein W
MIESEGDSNTYPTLALASTSQRIEDEDDVLQQQQQLMSTPPTSSVALSPYESQVINGLTTPEQNSGPENEWDN